MLAVQRGRERAALWRGVVLWGVTVIVLLALLLVVVALALSVRVAGSSMAPALVEGDRVVRIPGSEVERFDIVESHLADREIAVVKRVVGLPGDRIRITAGEDPEVLLQPAGEETTYVVVNPAWPDRIGDAREPCCAEDGTSLRAGQRPVTVEVPDGHYWLIGDNWGRSDDSRSYGFLAEQDLVGVLWLRVLPPGRFGFLGDAVRLAER